MQIGSYLLLAVNQLCFWKHSDDDAIGLLGNLLSLIQCLPLLSMLEFNAESVPLTNVIFHYHRYGEGRYLCATVNIYIHPFAASSSTTQTNELLSYSSPAFRVNGRTIPQGYGAGLHNSTDVTLPPCCRIS